LINLEQVKLLETKVIKAIDYVERVTKENAALQTRLESYKKRIDELEILIVRFKEDQGRIEDGILSALDRLNQFEDAIEKSLWEKPGKSPSRETSKTASAGAAAKNQAAAQNSASLQTEVPSRDANSDVPASSGADGETIFFEIPGGETQTDVSDPLAAPQNEETPAKDAENGELDIF
jgi:hypothetical protein